MNLAVAILWGALLPWCYGGNSDGPPSKASSMPMNPTTLEAELNNNYVVFNGIYMPLRKIYGEVQPTAANFHVGHFLQHFQIPSYFSRPPNIDFRPTDVEIFCVGGVYVEREILSERHTQDNPTAIAKKILHNENKKLNFLMGPRRSGKTILLKKIQLEVLKERPSVWGLYVNLGELSFANFETSGSLLQAIIHEHMLSSDINALLNNVLEVNPKQVVFFIDSIEKINQYYWEKVIELMDLLTKTHSTVVLSGCPYTLRHLKDKMLDPNVWEIPEMNFQEVRQFLTADFQQRKRFALANRPETITLTVKIEERLQEYALALTSLIFESPVPRQPGILIIWLDVLMSEPHGMTVVNYMFDHDIYMNLDSLKLIEWKPSILYSRLFMAINYRQYIDTFHIGTVAIAELLRRYETPRGGGHPSYARPLQLSPAYGIPGLETSTKYIKNVQPVVTYYIDGKVEFIYPEFLEYFAAHFLTMHLYQFDENVDDIVRLMFSEPKYGRVLEFFNGYILNNIEVEHIIHMVVTRVYNRDLQIMDNLLAHGFETLFSIFVEAYIRDDKLRELQDYFVDQETRPNFKIKKGFGTIHIVRDPAEYLPTRLELLIEHGMIELYRRLKTKITLISEGEHFQRLVQYAVTRPDMNYILIKEIISPPATMQMLDLELLIYAAINEVGEPCIPIADHLVNYEPWEINVNGRNLLHAAARWNSFELMEFIVDEFNSPLVINGQLDMSVISIALDANPSPLYTFPGWWQKMSYLVKHLGSQLQYATKIHRPASEINHYQIPVRDYKSEWFRLMIGSGPLDMTSPNFDANTMTFQFLSPMDDLEREQNLAKILTTSPAKWGLHPETLALRRKFLIQNLKKYNPKILFVELMVNYRGVYPLNSQDRKFYRETVTILLEWERYEISNIDRERIVTTLINNICDEEDFNDLLYFAKKGLVHEEFHANMYEILHYKVQQRLESSHQPIASVQVMKLQQVFLQSRAEYNPMIYTVPRYPLQLTRDPQLTMDQPSTSDGRSELFTCLTRRSRRNVRLFCHFSWNEVDQFNTNIEAHTAYQVSVDSDRFISTINAIEPNNNLRAQQLVQFVRELPNEPMGHSKMLMKDALEHGSLTTYRKYQRTTSAINDVSQPSSGARSHLLLPSKTAVIYGATVAISLIKGLVVSLEICMHNNTSSCATTSSLLALSMALPLVGIVGTKFMPLIVHSFSNTLLEMLPTFTPAAVKENIMLARNIGLRFGNQALGHVLNAAGFLFDVYSIYELSKLMDLCSLQIGGCPEKEKIDLIISLTFSCTSMVVSTGLMVIGAISVMTAALIGVALVILEMITLGINEVVFYSKQYQTTAGENSRIFFHKMFWQPPPADIQALARDANWMSVLNDRASRFLQDNPNVVALAIGLGAITDSSINSDDAIINMENKHIEYSAKLTRVSPQAKEGMDLLCLPRQSENKVYNKNGFKSISSVIYDCRNSLVVAHSKRWNSKDNKLSILYDLQYVDQGVIVGNQMFNNIFSIFKGTSELHIFGSHGCTIDTYMIRTDFFHGNIILNERAQKNVINLSTVASSVVQFTWSTLFSVGKVNLDNSSFGIGIRRGKLPNLHIIGREGKSDTFICNQYNTSRHQKYETAFISLDSGGGASLDQMDRITDCKVVSVRPFTYIIGVNSSDAIYTPYVMLDGSLVTLPNHPNVYAMIESLGSSFVVKFINRPLLFSTNSVNYHASMKTLTWNIQYTQSSALKLAIKPYHVSSPGEDFRNTTAFMFIDSYLSLVIYPVISDQPVTKFNLFGTLNSSRLEDVLDHYNNIRALQNPKFSVTTKLIEPKTNNSFMFGSNAADNFLIDVTTTFLYGSDGKDAYTLDRKSPDKLWIDNDASDGALDTLIVPDTLCKSLYARKGSRESMEDVTLTCKIDSMMRKKIILRNFMLHQSYQHLQILWRNASAHVLLPLHTDDTTINIVLFFSFDEQWKSTTLIIRNHRKYLALHGFSRQNPMVVYKSGSKDLIVTRKYFSHGIISSILLENFFTNASMISSHWLSFKLIIFDDAISVDTSKTLNTDGIRSMAILSGFNMGNREFIEEYTLNMSCIIQEPLIIEHHNTTQSNQHRLGILLILGGNPGNFNGIIQGSSLLLRTNETLVQIKDWCISPHHRLYRIEFIRSLHNRPILIQDIDRLECDDRNNHSELIDKLNQKFFRAQEQLRLLGDNDNDESRLIRCLATILTDAFAGHSMYKLFDFMSALDQASFIKNNCKTLFIEENLKHVSLEHVKKMLTTSIQIFELSDPSSEDRKAAELAMTKFHQLNDFCWKYFTKLLNSNITSNLIQEYLGQIVQQNFNCTLE